MTDAGAKQKLAGGFARLWEDAGRDRAKTRAGLTLAEIVAAAIEIADERGLSEVSMARVAKRLGYSTMALYRHVPNKGELLALMFDVGVGEPPASILEQSGWRARMQMYAQVFTDLFRRRPWLIDIPISGPPIGPNNISMLNVGLLALEETGLDIRDRVEVFMVLTSYLLGMQRQEIEMRRTGAAARGTGLAVDEVSYGRVLRDLLPAGLFPAVDAAILAGVFDDPDEDADAELRRGVDHILDGIEALMLRRRISSPGE